MKQPSSPEHPARFRPPADTSAQETGRTLVIHQGALGDFILTFPAMALLKRRLGPVDVLCRSGLGRVACRVGFSERHYSIDAAAFASLYTPVIDPPAKRILKTYDTIVLISYSEDVEEVLRRSLRSRLVRVPPRPPNNRRIHVSEFIVEELKNTGLVKPPADNGDVSDQAGCPSRSEQDRNRILLHPGAGSRQKRWPLTHFMTVNRRLQDMGLAPVIIIGPAEEDLALRITRGWKNTEVRLISDLDNLMDELEGAGGLIGNDSGVSHLSACMGVPTVALFGPTDPVRWRPLGPCVSVMQSPMGKPVEKSTGYRSNVSDSGLSLISPDSVLAEFLTLRESPPPSGSNHRQ